jgi:hypothetical protein
MIDERQKNIYNSFLHASRTAKNKPFKPRLNFEKLDGTTELALKKLHNFFKSHQSINTRDFFSAPYKIYSSDDFFDLKFFTTPRAIKCYVEYMKQLETSSADSEDTINRCKESCSFIFKYCAENKLTLQAYKAAHINSTPLYLLHLKEHKINFYTLHGLNITPNVSEDSLSILNFMFEDFFETHNKTRQYFIRSTRLKDVIRKALALVEEKLLIYHNTTI